MHKLDRIKAFFRIYDPWKIGMLVFVIGIAIYAELRFARYEEKLAQARAAKATIEKRVSELESASNTATKSDGQIEALEEEIGYLWEVVNDLDPNLPSATPDEHVWVEP
jgi:hypothetical protein